MNGHYDPDTFTCAERTVQKLINLPTTDDRPGILLGKVQSGKTRAFISTLALSFDNGYDIAVVLSKNSTALITQTVKRLGSEFRPFVDDEEVAIYDIMSSPRSFSAWELQSKIIFVAKKQQDNLARLTELLTDDEAFPGIKKHRVLIIDDEADNASVGYSRRDGAVEANTIATQISELRKALPTSSFLQVTATPYSLYLQPNDVVVNNVTAFMPTRPSFTELVPVPAAYVGGETYFGEESRAEEPTVQKLIHQPVTPKELDNLKAHDGRSVKLNEILTSPGVASFRRALITFLVGGCIQKINGIAAGEKPKKLRYSFLLHTEAGRVAHAWQGTLTDTIIDAFGVESAKKSAVFESLVKESWDDLAQSLALAKENIPSLADVTAAVREALDQGAVTVAKVNSDEDVSAMLDDSGQLRLRSPLNVFVGGQVLDRGITVANLIGFYYGRRPIRMQQDTVLQHSRMYGYRRKDLAVTRFYTAPNIRGAMYQMEEFDRALRSAIELEKNGKGSGAVQFIRQATDGSIIPCSPNKILVTTTQTLRANKRILPIGFQSGYKTGAGGIGKTVDALTAKITTLVGFDAKAPVLVPLQDALDLLEAISETLVFEDEDAPEFDWDVARAALRYLSNLTTDEKQRGKVLVWATRGRKSSRLATEKSHATYIETPDSAKTEGLMATEFAIEHPILFLLGQEGTKEKGWRDTEFYWPVIRAQKLTPSTIYSTELDD